MAFEELLSEALGIGLYAELKGIRPLLAQAAQAVYDEWDGEGGGICDEIAQGMWGVIGDYIDAEISEGGHEGDDHAYLMVSRGDEKYVVDIPSHVYEKGGGYSWRKIKNVIFVPDNVVIARL